MDRRFLLSVPAFLLVGFAYLLRFSLLAQNISSAPVNLQVIVVDSPDQARQIRDRLKHGEDFSKLAKETSIAPSASQGGYVGTVDPATLRPELRVALQGIGPGQLTEAIAVPSGYVILKVLPENLPSAGQGMGPGQAAVGQGMGPGQGRDLSLSAKGAVRYPADVAGQVLADMLFQKFPKPANWEQNLRGICDARKQSLDSGVARLEELFSPANRARLAGMTPFDVIQSHYALAQLHA